MISTAMKELVENSSAIRAMFEEGKRLAAIHGSENIFDYSLGNPSAEPPLEIATAIEEILNCEAPNFVHGYMQNAGYQEVRNVIAQSINQEFHVHFSENNIVMTVGAAGALNVVLKTLLNPGDEVVVFAPYFSEYQNYVKNYNGSLVVIPPDTQNFQLRLDLLEKNLSVKTKAVLINSPNNPSGAIYSETTLKQLSDILTSKQKEVGHPIYVISDEPYRKLVYGDASVPYMPKFYDNTFIAYSYSKALSLPGERIGYLALPSEMDGFEEIIAALSVANRILGYVNAPSLFQLVAAKCINASIDTSYYEKNLNRLYDQLTDLGFQCRKPEGAFYLFPQSLEKDDIAFCNQAKEYRLLLAPGSSFGCPGFFRLSYCVPYETVERSLPAFEKLVHAYRS